MRPYTLSGPYLKKLFDRSLIDGLHYPGNRPKAFDWFIAADKTIGLLVPCENPECDEKWFVYSNEKEPKCPFCGRDVKESYPILNFYTSREADKFESDDLRMFVTETKHIYHRHISGKMSNTIIPQDWNQQPYCDFKKEGGKWYIINKRLSNMLAIDGESRRSDIPLEGAIELKDGLKLVFDCVSKNRLVIVQMLNPM